MQIQETYSGIFRRLSLASPSLKSHLLWQEMMAFVQLLYVPCYLLLSTITTFIKLFAPLAQMSDPQHFQMGALPWGQHVPDDKNPIVDPQGTGPHTLH